MKITQVHANSTVTLLMYKFEIIIQIIQVISLYFNHLFNKEINCLILYC